MFYIIPGNLISICGLHVGLHSIFGLHTRVGLPSTFSWSLSLQYCFLSRLATTACKSDILDILPPKTSKSYDFIGLGLPADSAPFVPLSRESLSLSSFLLTAPFSLGFLFCWLSIQCFLFVRSSSTSSSPEFCFVDCRLDTPWSPSY